MVQPTSINLWVPRKGPMNLKERMEQKQFRASDYHSARSLKFTTFVCPKIFTKQLSGLKNNCGVSPDSGGVDLNKKDLGNVV